MLQTKNPQPTWGGGRAPPQPPGQVIQISAVSSGGGLTGGGAEMVQLFALLNDGSIWRLQEWRPGEWDEISLPGPVAAARVAAPSSAMKEALRLAQEAANRRQASEGLPDPAEGRRIVEPC